MRYLTLLLIIANLPTHGQQVAKQVVLEHFTNTYCSVCATRNPPLYNNISSHPGVFHIAYHPSSPYAACPLSMHNVPENNARTNHYGVFGATPRLVIQGVVQPGSVNFADPATISSAQGQTTSFSMTVAVAPLGTDSVTTTVVIKKEDTSSLTTLELYAALAEDTLFVASANGEPASYDVFRKAIWGASSLSITAPAAVGESVTFSRNEAVNSIWVRKRMYVIAMLQDGAKNMVQAAKSANLPDAMGMEQPEQEAGVVLYPNPANSKLFINKLATYPCPLVIYQVSGRLQTEVTLQSAGSHIDVSGFAPGLYIVKGLADGNPFVRSFLKN